MSPLLITQLAGAAALPGAQGGSRARSLALAHAAYGVPGRHVSFMIRRYQHARGKQVVDSFHAQCLRLQLPRRRFSWTPSSPLPFVIMSDT